MASWRTWRPTDELQRHPGAIASVVLIAGLVAAGLAAGWQARANAAIATAHLDATVARVVAQLGDRLRPRDPRAVAAVGAVIAGLLASLLYVFVRSTQRTTPLREQALRAAIVASATDAIVTESLAGIVIDWNRAAERLFGYPAHAAIGRSVASLLLPDSGEPQHTKLRTRIALGQEVPPFDAVRRTADGSLLEVSIAASPVHADDGRIVGVAETLRDLRRAKAAARGVLQRNAMLEQQVGERTVSLESARHELKANLDTVPSMIGCWDS